jgi:hypothetical protein
VIAFENTIEEGNNVISINTTDLPDGIYIFELENNGKINRSRFMISR